MNPTQATGQIKEMSIEATIIRADGTKVPLGVVSYWHANPIMRLIHLLKKRFR